jgi:small-conductance mechanosensitive channel
METTTEQNASSHMWTYSKYAATAVVVVLLLIWYCRKAPADPTQKLMSRVIDLQTRADKIAAAIATLIRSAEQRQSDIPTGLSTTHQRQINIAMEMASLHDHNDTMTDILKSLQQIERAIIAKEPPRGIKRKLRAESDAMKALLNKLQPPPTTTRSVTDAGSSPDASKTPNVSDTAPQSN